MIQGSPEWFEARRGKATASRFNDVMATLKSGGEAASRANYRTQLVLERITGNVEESYQNDAMRWGTEQEPFARMAYEVATGNIVEEVSFIDHELMAGCSPDGLIGADGGLEIKCPQSTAHIETLLSRAIPSKYVAQVQGSMWVTGRAWWDFVSFDPRMPEKMQLVIVRVNRDEAYIKNLSAEVEKFLTEVDETVAKLRSMYV